VGGEGEKCDSSKCYATLQEGRGKRPTAVKKRDSLPEESRQAGQDTTGRLPLLLRGLAAHSASGTNGWGDEYTGKSLLSYSKKRRAGKKGGIAKQKRAITLMLPLAKHRKGGQKTVR